MSYSRTFERTIRVPHRTKIKLRYDSLKKKIYIVCEGENKNYEFTYSYLFEKNAKDSYNLWGSSKSLVLDDYVDEDVKVKIDIDTDPFDYSISNCNDQVNGLTASVSAMNAAQCLAISNNADKVSKTIVDGFFHTVRTDLETQKAELEQTIESRLILLKQQATSLQEKQKVMRDDYARTTARYQKIFDDLNNELSVRIHQIDQPVFNLVKDVNEQNDRMLRTDMIQTAVTMSKESSLLQAQINAATVKRHALEAMGQAQTFLTTKALSEKAIQDTCIEGNGDDRYLVPVCYIRTESEGSLVQQICEMPDYYFFNNPNFKGQLCDKLEKTELGDMDANDKEQLNSYILSEIDKNIATNDEHSDRIRELINKMLNK